MVKFRASNPMMKVIQENFVLALNHSVRSQLGDTSLMDNDAVVLKASKVWAAVGPAPFRQQAQPFNIEAIRRPYEASKERPGNSDT